MRVATGASADELLRSERLEKLSTLARAVGHELNNLLVVFDSVLASLSERKRAGLPLHEEDEAELEHVRAHLAVHARQLLHLDRGGSSTNGPADLHKMVQGTIARLRSAGLLDGVQVRLEMDPPPVLVRIDETRAVQVLVNLLKNAVDALQGDPRSRNISVTVAIDGERQVACCAVADEGCGVPHSELPHLFTPYYTTKPPGRGTGLGLFVVKQILDACGGTIDVESRSGVGTTFTFKLPIARAAGTDAPSPAGAVPRCESSSAEEQP